MSRGPARGGRAGARAALCGLLLGLAPGRGAEAASLTVTDCGDQTPGGAPGQLRRLITEATAGDVILVPACVVVLTGERDEDGNQTGDLDVDKALTLQGAGPGRTILDGGGIDRVLHVLPGASLGVFGVTVRNGNPGADDGGAFLDRGALRLVDTLVTGNQAIFGGAIATFPGTRLTMIGVTLAGNTASLDGGGVDAFGEIEIVNATISGNRAGGFGGGLSAGGVLTLDNVTLVGNRARADGGVPGEGGGVYVGGGPLLARNSILAGNRIGSGEDPSDCSGPLTVVGPVLLQDPTGCVLEGHPGLAITGAGPDLEPLRPAGGPTPTHVPRPGSPALAAGDAACAFADQRGVVRPAGSCDLGAYQRSGLTARRLP